MNLNDVKSAGRYRKRKRVGRGPGSGSGKTAGRGSKGQGSRSGSGGKLGFEGGQMPLYRRLPKRGFNNSRFRVEHAIVNVNLLARLEATELDLEALKGLGVVGKKARRLKVLGEGELGRAMTVKAHRFSESAKQKIEAAGGRVEVLP